MSLKDKLRTKREDYTVANEAFIKPQLDDWFTEWLENEIRDLVGYTIDDPEVKSFAKELEMNIKKRFGMPTKVVLKSESYYFATMPPATLYPILSNWDKNILDIDDKDVKKLKRMYEKFIKEITVIDMDKGYIKFSNELSDRYVTSELYLGSELTKQSTLDAKELTAVIMHEIGHMFSYFVSLWRTVRTNSLLLETFLESKVLPKDKIKRKIVVGLKALGMKVKEDDDPIMIAEIVAANLKDAFDMIKHMEGMSSRTDSENLADKFAVRFGYGKHLASALAKLMVDSSSVWGYTKLMMYSLLIITLQVSLITLISGGTFIVGNVLVLSIAVFLFVTALEILLRLFLPLNFPYDNVKHRMNLIKRNMIEILRIYGPDKKTLKEWVEEIDYLDDLVKTIEKSWLSDMFITIFTTNPNMGKVMNKREIIKNILNDIVNNDFHYLAAKAETLRRGK